MKATDLRIGNLVTINNLEFWPQLKDVPLAVYSITPNRSIKNEEWSYSIGLISLNERDNITMPLYAQMIEFIEPIKLTEDRLLMLGFEISYSSNFRLKFDHSKTNEIGFDFSHTPDKSMEGLRYYGHYIKIEHVHQLQNIYNSLTGFELASADA